MDKALKKLNEEKNIINSDIDMIRFVFYDGKWKFNEFSPLFRNDIRTNENARRNQDSMFTNKLGAFPITLLISIVTLLNNIVTLLNSIVTVIIFTYYQNRHQYNKPDG